MKMLTFHTKYIQNWDTNNTIPFLGASMAFSNFVEGEPKGNPYLHMNFDNQFAWDTKDDANDRDNGFICKKKHVA